MVEYRLHRCFPNGVAPGSNDGNSVLTLHYAYTLNQAIKLFESFGDDCLAEKYATISNRIRKVWMLVLIP